MNVKKMTNNSMKSDIERIADRINDAIMEHRLAPGTKLSETRMAEAFDVSRTKIRQVLIALARSGLVRLFPNRGAYIVSPTVAEALEILAARRVLEPEILKGVITHVDRPEHKRLRQHLSEEKSAREASDRRAIIRLSGDFHMLLASMSGNRYIAKMMGELCPLTCLIISLYDLPQNSACPEEEHGHIVDAIEQRDTKKAIEVMLHHLGHIESALHFDSARRRDVDWESILG